jgi:hypothetical protein
MSDFFTGREIRDDLAPETRDFDRRGEMEARDEMARAPAAGWKVEVPEPAPMSTASVGGEAVPGERLETREPALAVEREPMTIEAIERDPTNAIVLDLPEDASKELLLAVGDAASQVRRDAGVRAQEARGEADRWDALSAAADERFDEAMLKHDLDLARDAWQAPEFSRETIAADAWTAVYLPVPENPDPGLLLNARNWASELEQYAEGFGAFSQPLVDERAHTPEQGAAAAADRVVDLDSRLGQMREAALMIEEDRASVETREPRSGLLSLESAAERASEHMARAIDLFLGSIIGYFVSEPELTPQQIHDLTRANAERDESRAIERAAQEDAAQLENVNWESNRNRSPVHSAGDEVRRGESIHDRYPGLTYDDSGGNERERESERAFYDTGIERGR